MCVSLCVCIPYVVEINCLKPPFAYFRYGNPSDFWMEMTYMTCQIDGTAMALELLWSMLLKGRLETPCLIYCLEHDIIYLNR